MDKLLETMTESQLETLFRSSGAFDRMRSALEEKLLDHTDDTRAATQKLIADNPNADAVWIINEIPSQIMVNTERNVRKELDQAMGNADNKAEIHRLFQEELLGIRASVSPSSSLSPFNVSQDKIQVSTTASSASAKETSPITMAGSSNAIEVSSNAMVGPSSLTSAKAGSVTAISGQGSTKTSMSSTMTRETSPRDVSPRTP